MKSAPPQLIALLASGQFHTCEAVEITLADGTVLRWTSAEQAVTFGSAQIAS